MGLGLRSIVLISICTLAGCSKAPQRVSVCDIVADPESYYGVKVIVSGESISHRHGTILTSRACPEVGIVLKGSGDSEVDAFLSESFGIGVPPPPHDRRLFATLTGSYKHFPGEYAEQAFVVARVNASQVVKTSGQ